LEDAFAAMKKAAVQALVVLTDPILFSQRKRTVDFANKNQLPAMYFFQGFAEEGGLMSYGPSDADLFRRTAGYVDRILKGAKPGDCRLNSPPGSNCLSISKPPGCSASSFQNPS
jgi:putative tryptophan/tyrosine transport system substrate-binding protein